MIVRQRNAQRRHIRSGACDIWLTFHPEGNSSVSGDGFGSISVFNEYHLPSAQTVLSGPVLDTELITCISRGALILEAPSGSSGAITAGEFQCATILQVVNLRMTNLASSDIAHFFRIYLRLPDTPDALLSVEEQMQQMRFTAAERHNVLCPVVSPDLPRTLRSTTNSRVFSGILDPGRHIVYELPPRRKVWLHIVCGAATANEVHLTYGDGIGITDEPSISITVTESTELLLVDMPEGDPGTPSEIDSATEAPS